MNQIYRFNEFVLISESEKRNGELFNDLKKVIMEKLFQRWINCPNFGGVYAKYSRSEPDLKEIFYKWGGKEKKIKGIFYDDNGDFFYEEYPNDIIKIGKKYDYRFNSKFFASIEQDIMYSCGTPIFNPFTYNIEDLPIIKKLKEIGMEIISNDMEKSKGILVLKFKNSYYYDSFIIKPSGEINYKKRKEKDVRSYYNWEKSIDPINNLEDLIKKIICVYIEYLKDVIDYNELPIKGFPERLISALKSKETTNNPIYKEEYDKIINEYPKMALYLIKPDGVENEELIKGVRLLDRSELLDR